MKKAGNLSIKRGFSMGLAAVIVVMLVIPFLENALEVMFGIETGYAIAVLIYSFLKHRKAMPVLFLTFALFSLAVNISYIRAALLGYESGRQVPLVCFFSNLPGENNYFVAFVIGMILMVLQVIIVTKGAERVVEVSERFSLDSINHKFFDSDEKLAVNQISEEEFEKQKKAVQEERGFYSRLNGSAKFLKSSTKVTIVIILVNIFGGFAMEKLKLGTFFHEALEAAVRITAGNMVVFLLLLLVVSLALTLFAGREKIFLRD